MMPGVAISAEHQDCHGSWKPFTNATGQAVNPQGGPLETTSNLGVWEIYKGCFLEGQKNWQFRESQIPK